MTLKGLAKLLRMHPKYIGCLTKAGTIPHKTIGSRRRVFGAAICRWLVGRRVPAKGGARIDALCNIPEDFLRPCEAAEVLGIVPRTLASYRKRGLIPFWRFGTNTVRYRRSELEKWAAK
jgi:excisionase family DNA binding protein